MEEEDGRVRPALIARSIAGAFRRPRSTLLLSAALAVVGIIASLGGDARALPVVQQAIAGEPTVVVSAPAPGQQARFAWPVNGPISSYFDEEHPLGIDVGLYFDPNAPIRASAGGAVVFAGGQYCCSYGYHVIIDHGGGWSTLYAHFSEIVVSEGQVVARGQRLGLGGDSGYSTSEHLHFEVRLGEDRLDPLLFLHRDIESPN